ncbi:MAG: SPOR domain-containing protein [Rhodospirillaceae bacterium]
MARRGRAIRVSAEDALEFEPEPAPKRRIPTTFWMGLSLVLITIAGLGGFLFGDRLASVGADGPNDVPVVHAEQGPIKERPKNPGGEQIPFRGYEINQRAAGEGSPARVEKLLPAPEQPMAKPAPVAQPAPQTPAKPELKPEPKTEPPKTAPVQSAESLLPLAPPPAPKPVEPKPKGKSVPEVNVASAPKSLPVPSPPTTAGGPVRLDPKAVKAPEPAAVIAPPAPPKPLEPVSPPVRTTGAPKNLGVAPAAPSPQTPATQTTATQKSAVQKGWQVQLAASRAAAAASAEGERLKKKFEDVLGKYRVAVVRADLGAKGVFYRIRLGPAADKDQARAVCAKLSARGQGCLVVAPGK